MAGTSARRLHAPILGDKQRSWRWLPVVALQSNAVALSVARPRLHESLDNNASSAVAAVEEDSHLLVTAFILGQGGASRQARW